MTAPACFIVNSRSHRVRRHGSVLEQVARESGTALLQIDDFSNLPDALARLADKNPALVCIEGGDGTVQAVLSGWPGLSGQDQALPSFAILPGGSTNLIWEIAGLKQVRVREVRAFLACQKDIPVCRIVDLPAIRLESPALSRPQIGFLLSTGALASAMAYTQTAVFKEGRRGAPAIAGAIVRFLISPSRFIDQTGQPILRPYALSATSSSFNFTGAHALSLVTTLPHLSLGITPFWADGRGAIAYTHAQWPLRGLRRAFFRILLGQTGPGMIRHGLASYRTDALSLRCDGPAMLDGELLADASGLAIQVSLTRPIRFLR